MATKYDKNKKVAGFSLRELGIYEFGDGEWNYEPDRVEWVDAPSRLPCMILRGPMGNWNGYVGVDREHAAFGAEHNDIDLAEQPHGGLTYADFDNSWITFLTDDVGRRYWLGFDCAHGFDIVPALDRLANIFGAGGFGRGSYAGYRNMRYAQRETTALAAALHAFDLDIKERLSKK